MITITAAFVFLGTADTIGAVQGGTFGLGFNTLPVVFAHMGSAGQRHRRDLVPHAVPRGDHQFDLDVPAVARVLPESLGWSREKATGLMVAVCVFGLVPGHCYSRGGIFWSTIDDWVGTFLIFVLAMVQIICFSWVFGIDRGIKEAHAGATIHIPVFYRWIMKYVTPTYLVVVFAAFCWQNLKAWVQSVADEPLRQGAIALIIATIFLLVLCTMIGERRWRDAGLDLNGREELGE